MEKIIDELSIELNIEKNKIGNTIKLIDEGNTIPFIARYRKEVTGNLSDEVLRKLNAVSVFTVSDFMEADHSLYPGYYNTYEESVILVNLSKFKSKFKGKVLEKRM